MSERPAGTKRRRMVDAPRPARLSGDRGAVIAEAALLTPFFVTMLFGVLEFGGAFRDYLTLTNGVNAGAREESIAGNQTNADQLTLDAIAKATNAFQAGEIQKIVVFYANSPDASVPASCLTGPVSQNPLPRGPSTVLCNFYTGSIYPTSGTTTWGSCSLNTDPDRFYCPGGRIASVSGPPDYIGVYIEIQHPWVTGLFGNSLTMSKTSLTRIEPQSLN